MTIYQQVDTGSADDDGTGDELRTAFDKVNANAALQDVAITLDEVTTSPVPGVAKGKLWVKDDAPNVLMFTNDIGTSIELGAGGGGGVSDHTLLTEIGTNTHVQLDAHLADATLHFTAASLDHTAIQNIGTNTHAQIDTKLGNSVSHIADGTVHFTQGAISIPLTQGASDVTATAGELNLLDLAGMTVDWILSADSGTTASWKAAPTEERIYNHAGILRAFIGVTRWYPMRDVTISEIRANVGDPSTVQDILINIKKNGAIVVTDLTIPQTTYRSALDTTVIAMTTADYITVDIKQIGTGNAGQDLTVNFKYN